MDYDKTAVTVTLRMTQAQFETVHKLLSEFVQAVEGAPDSFDAESREDVKRIKTLEYVFEEAS